MSVEQGETRVQEHRSRIPFTGLQMNSEIWYESGLRMPPKVEENRDLRT